MSAAKKISKEAIIDAAVDVLREGGFASINARSVARKLGCSTQPIYASFENMEELKAALTERAVSKHIEYVRNSLETHHGDGNRNNAGRYSSYGMGFVKFAMQEKQLFRWLYLEGKQIGPYQNDVLLSEIIQIIVEDYGYSEEIAKKFHQDMTYYSYGLAILVNTDHLYMTDQELMDAFRREFTALAAYYGTPEKRQR